VSVAIGAGVLLVSDGLIYPSSFGKNVVNLAGSVVAQSDSENTRASLITVKVYYSMMAQYTDLDEEGFVLQGPATVQQLINTALIRHPSMAQMTGSMMVLLNGVPANASALLRDGDVVQFIPLSAGG
jgi:molybdopterin converting factor small subunit